MNCGKFSRFIGSLLLPLVLLVSGCSSRSVYVPPAPNPEVQRPYYREVPRRPSPAPETKAPRSTKDVAEKRLVSLDRPRTVTHEVGPMETIWRISRIYDVPADTICSANGIKPGDQLKIGQKLTIPGAKSMRHIIGLYPNKQWKYIIVHHTASELGNALMINRSHSDRGFWYGLGYHFLIDNGTQGKGDGQIEPSPRWIKQQNGAHCKAGGMNEKAIGVSLVGNFNEELPTPSQVDSLVYLLETLCRYYGIPRSNILGHRDVPGSATDCPGKRFPWSSIRPVLSGR